MVAWRVFHLQCTLRGRMRKAAARVAQGPRAQEEEESDAWCQGRLPWRRLSSCQIIGGKPPLSLLHRAAFPTKLDARVHRRRLTFPHPQMLGVTPYITRF